MKFHADDDQLTITLEGVEVFWGLKRQLVIPRSRIIDLSWEAQLYFTDKIWRTLGTGIPGVLYAGHFRGGGQRYFLYLRQPRGISWTGVPIEANSVLAITTEDYPYRQILLTCERDIGLRLTAWWRSPVPAG